MLNILTVDVEEWYDPEYVRNKAPAQRDEQVTESVDETLSLLREKSIKATFFIVGEIAQKHPELVEQLRKNGHEVGFHGFRHEPLWNLDAEVFRSEIDKFNGLVKEKCLGFRAPSFSLSNRTKWAVNVLKEQGFTYDSSIVPAKTPLYGVYNAPQEPYRLSHDDVAAKDENGTLWEFPLLVYSTKILRLPVAGGFYLRFFPLKLIKRAIKNDNKLGRPAVLYVHTWELNPKTPRLSLGLYKSFVTYHNIEKTADRLKKLLSDFHFTSIREYMEDCDFV